MASSAAETVGARIRRYREELDLSLSDLAERAEVSKGYLSVLENDSGDENRRPSGTTLLRVATALGITIGDLLGESNDAAELADLPPGLREFAEEHGLPETDIRMLAQIEFRGKRPRSAEAWQFVYQAIQLNAGR